MALSFQRYKIKSNLGITSTEGYKVSGTSTEALDECLRRVRRCQHDLRVVQSQLGDFLHHKRSAFAAGRGFTAALSRFFQNAAIDAVAPTPVRGSGSAQHDPSKAGSSSPPPQNKVPTPSPDLKPMEELFRAGSAGPTLTGAVEHITEGIQVRTRLPDSWWRHPPHPPRPPSSSTFCVCFNSTCCFVVRFWFDARWAWGLSWKRPSTSWQPPSKLWRRSSTASFSNATVRRFKLKLKLKLAWHCLLLYALLHVVMHVPTD